ncbi:hypothetical protein ACLK1G_09990 [Pseudomonas sp. NR3]|uniref:hypothetical protein n=1 Tax=Pseudomonas sp. NR3 TaxID=3155978 RepID=UPI003B67E843
MNSKDPRYKDNFISNGDFAVDLTGWTPRNAIHATDLWNGNLQTSMHVYDGGTGEQTFQLALLPRPQAGKADYQLLFYYDAYGNAPATLKVKTAPGGAEETYELVASREADDERPVESESLKAIDFQDRYFSFSDLVAPTDESVTVTFISAPDTASRDRGVRVTLVRGELKLEDLRLNSLTIEGKTQPANEPLRLCFGAQADKAHPLTLEPEDDSVWKDTNVGIWLEDDPADLLELSPPWKQELAIDSEWQIGCRVPADDSREYPQCVQIQSQYTAAPYPLPAISGHFRLELAVMQDVAYYPVVPLEQSVTMRVKVQSHYTPDPVADREVTWAVTSQNAMAPLELFTQRSDENGESSFTYTPTAAGVYQVTASVDSYYYEDDAKHVFEVRALADDPWETATFALENTTTPITWGTQPAYPCRGGSHQATITFPTGHALAGTDLTLIFSSDQPVNPIGLGATFSPDLDVPTAIDGDSLTWRMAYEDKGIDAEFKLTVSCSKLLEASPAQTMQLAHNWLDIVDNQQAPKFPYIGGADLDLRVQVSSKVPGVGTVRDIEVQWQVDEGDPTQRPTGNEGWSAYRFDFDEPRTFQITASAASPYEDADKRIQHTFDVEVYKESPWQSLVSVTLNDKAPSSGRLVFFLDSEAAELRVMPQGDPFIDEEIWLEVGGDADPPIEAIPDFGTVRKMTEEGLSWSILPTATASTRFGLNICHEEMGPFEFNGLLLSTTLEGEGELKLDDKVIRENDKLYPSIGGTHTLSFLPNASSPLTLLDVAALWASDDLGVGLVPAPGEPMELEADGVAWTLTVPQTASTGESGLSLDFPQIELTYPSVGVNLGHHHFRIEGTDPDVDLWVGESTTLTIQVWSHYTRTPLGNIEVTFGDSEKRHTDGTGKATFTFTATDIGEARIIAEVPSPYYAPGDYPSHVFVIDVYGR